MCWECEESFLPKLTVAVEKQLTNGNRIIIDPEMSPRGEVPQRPAAKSLAVMQAMIRKDLEETGASADNIAAAAEVAAQTVGLMLIDDWIDQTLAAKNYIQAQEDREDFILRTGAGATKFNKWMKKAGLYFNKQTGRWTRYGDR
jgi:hypothetical protein